MARTRLLLAAAFVDLLRYAYRSLQSHDVDYLKLPAYKDTTLLDAAAKLPINEGADSYISWIGRVRNDIKAAIARKGFKAIGAKRTPPPKDTIR